MSVANFETIFGPIGSASRDMFCNEALPNYSGGKTVSESVRIAETTRSKLVAHLGSRAKTIRIETMIQFSMFPRGWRWYDDYLVT